MRPWRHGCGTVSNAQLLTLPETISTSAPGVVTTQLSFLPPASSSATEMLGSSERRPATAQPPEPAPTTTKSNVSVTRFPPVLSFSGIGASVAPECYLKSLRHESQHLFQPCDLGAVGRIKIGQPIER